MITANRPSDAPSASPTVIPKLPVTLDTKGRVRTSKEQRRVILAEFERSGLSAARFARQTGLKYPTFAAWVARHRRTQRPPPPLRLLEAVVAPVPTSLPLQVRLPGGACAELRDASHIPLLVALIHALAKSC